MAPSIRFRITSALREEYAWTLEILGRFAGFSCMFTEGECDIAVAEQGDADIRVSHFFRNSYLQEDFEWKSYFRNALLHFTADDRPDYLSTCFYLLACVQEYADYVPDRYGRFPYKSSVQARYNCVQENLVALYFDKILQDVPYLRRHITRKPVKSKFFLTHDIDSVYGALGDNAGYLLRHAHIGTLLQLILHHYFRDPDYLRLGRIMDMEDTHDVRSTFFWLVNKGPGTRLIRNADYDISAPRVRRQLASITARGFTNGLHKSVSGPGYAKELESIGGESMPVNRNHYLLLELPSTWEALERGGILLDSSLGFAEEIGYRNGYALPVNPFHVKERRPCTFLEVPLHIMDSTLKFYRKMDPAHASEAMFAFLEKHRQDALLTVLWHNNYFFDYRDRGWLQLYKDLLDYIRSNDMEALNPQELLEGG